jgi:hypothetical protein
MFTGMFLVYLPMITLQFIQFEYIKNNLIRKSEAHKNRVTKCNENRSKEETKNKAPKIINTGKYMINQPVNITSINLCLFSDY